MHIRNSILEWPIISVVLFFLLGVSSLVVAQDNSVKEARELDQKALDLVRQNRFGDALPLIKLALAIREKVLGPEHLNTSKLLNNLAEIYRITGVHVQAEALYKRSLTIREKILGTEHLETAASLNNLAALYVETGAYQQAEPLLKRALAIREKVLGPEHPHTARVLHNLASLYKHTGVGEQAEPLYKRALAIQEKALGPKHPGTVMSVNNLAELYRAMGAYAKAEPLYQRALTISERVLGPEHPNTGLILDNLSVLYWANADLARALPLMRRTQANREKDMRTVLLTGSELRKQAYLAQVRGETFTSITFSLLMQNRQAKQLAFRDVLMAKGRVLDDIFNSTRYLRRSVDPEDQRIVKHLIEVVRQRSTLIYQGLGNLKPDVYRMRLKELAARQEQLETDLSTRSAEFRQEIAPITLIAIQSSMPKDAALVEWYRYLPFDPRGKRGKDGRPVWGKSRYVAYVLKSDGEPDAVEFDNAEVIDQLVHDFRSGLGNPTSTYAKDVAKELGERLYKPLQRHVGDVKHLLISPDGA